MTSNRPTLDVATPSSDTVRAGRHRAGPPPAIPQRRRRGARTAAVGCFTTLVALANAAAYHHPLIPVGFGLSATASTLAVALIAMHNTWVRDVGGQRLVFAAIAAATLVSACAAGAFGVAWGLAYLVAELVGLCTWRPLRQLGARDGQVLVGIVLTSLVEAAVYVALISAVVTATVGGQLLGKAEAALATAAVGMPIRAAWRRRHRRAAAAGGHCG